MKVEIISSYTSGLQTDRLSYWLSLSQIDLQTPNPDTHTRAHTHTHTYTHTKGSALPLIRSHMNDCSSLQLLRLCSSNSFKDLSGGGRGTHCGSHWGHFLYSPPRSPSKMVWASSLSSPRLSLLPLFLLCSYLSTIRSTLRSLGPPVSLIQGTSDT